MLIRIVSPGEGEHLNRRSSLDVGEDAHDDRSGSLVVPKNNNDFHAKLQGVKLQNRNYGRENQCSGPTRRAPFRVVELSSDFHRNDKVKRNFFGSMK